MPWESLRIADQLRRAFNGDAWHGPPLSKLLSNVDAGRASSRPVPSAHTIWELVLHIDLYVRIAKDAISGVPMPKLYGTEKDWFEIAHASASAWTAATTALFANAEKLAQGIERLDDAALLKIVPGREYDFYYLFHGIVQHSLYHAGQIALLAHA
jgi:hypothetical protein